MAGERGQSLGAARWVPPPPPSPAPATEYSPPLPSPLLCQGNTWRRHLFHLQQGSPPGLRHSLFRIVAFFVQRREFLGRAKPLQLVQALSPPAGPGCTARPVPAEFVWWARGCFPISPSPFCLPLKRMLILAKYQTSLPTQGVCVCGPSLWAEGCCSHLAPARSPAASPAAPGRPARPVAPL